MILCQRDRVLLSIVISKHRAADQLVSLRTQDLRHLAKGNQVLLLRLLEALEMD